MNQYDFSRRIVLAAALGGMLLSTVAAQAANRYWDGGTTDISGNGNGASGGNGGTWDTTTKNWDAGAVPHTNWVNANNDTAIFGGTAGTVSLGTGITVGGLQFDTANYLVQSNTLTFGTSGSITANQDATISSVIAGTAAITKAGASKLTLSGSNTCSGGITSSAGALQVNNALALGSGTLTINSVWQYLRFNLGGDGTVSNTIQGITQVIIVQETNSNLTLSGNITGDVKFRANNVISNGTITLSGSNTFANGAIQGLYGLTLVLANNNAYNASAGTLMPDSPYSCRILLMNGVNFPNQVWTCGGYGMSGSGTATFISDIYQTLACTISTPAGAQLSFTGVWRQNGAVTKTGAGTVIFTVAGAGMPVTVSDGVFQFSPMDAIGAGATYGTTLDGGTLRYVGAAGTTARPLTLTAKGGALDASGSGPATYSSTAAVTYSGSGNRTLTLRGSNTGTNTLVAAIGNNGADVVSVTKSDTGTWVLSGTNSYTGATTISNGVLKLSATGSISNSATINVASGAVFDVSAMTSGYTLTNQTLAGNGVVTGNVTVVAGGSLAPGGTNATGTLSFSNTLTLAEGAVVNWNYDDTTNDVIRVATLVSLPTVATVNVSRVSGSLPSPAVLFTFGAGAGYAATDTNLSNWVITGARGDTRAVVRNKQVLLLTSNGMIVEIY